MTQGSGVTISIPKSFWRLFNVIFCEIVFVWLMLLARTVASAPWSDARSWLIGDWLINYQGGFVRRGLVGEVLLRISSLSGIEIGILVAVLQMLFYLVFLVSVCSLSANSSFTPLNVVLICSPAFILFPVLDPGGGFRKEILLIALLSVLCNLLANRNTVIPKYLPASIGLASLAIVLSHEMLVVYFPYVVCALIIYEKRWGIGAKKATLFMAPAAVTAMLIVVFGRANSQVVLDICSSLRTSAPPDCLFPDVGMGGAITFLDKDVAYAHSYVLTYNSTSTLLVYAGCVLLAFAPLVLKFRSKQFKKSLVNSNMRFWMTICIGFAFLSSLPLFWIVLDYGRIIYIHVACLSLLTLMATQERSSAPLCFRFNTTNVAVWLLSLLFIISWRLPHHDASPQNAITIYSVISRAFDW